MKKKLNDYKKEYNILFPIFLFIFIVPLIVRMKIIEIPLNRLVWREDIISYADIFTYYKGIFIILAAFISSLIIFKKQFIDEDKAKIDKYKKLIFISIGFIILVTFLSEHKDTSMWGYISRAEGALVLISYLIMTFYISEIVRSKKQMKVLLYLFLVLGFISSIVGIYQLLGKDIFRTEFLQKIYLLEEYTIEDINFKVNEKRVYMTLFNPNYVGSFVTLLFTFSLNMIIRRKKIIKKLVWLILAVLLIISLIGSQSEAGFIGVLFGLIATFIMNFKFLLKNKKILVFILIILISSSSLTYYKFKDHRYIKSISRTFTSLDKKVETPLKSIETKANILEIEYKGERLLFTSSMQAPHEQFNLMNSEKKRIELKYNKKKKFYYGVEKKYRNIRVYLDKFGDYKGYRLIFDGRRYDFAMYKNKLLYVNRIGRLVSLDKVDYVKAFEGYEHLGSGRFYIWSRTLPLLKKTWLIGFGPDHFVYNFPQTDYVGKNMKNMRMVNTVVDKPHNMYLQYAVNIGVIPLLILLAFWFMLLYELFKIVKAEELDDIYLTVAAASFSAIIGFMAVGMFNDSTVNVSTIFWGIVGLGLAVVNYNRYDHYKFKSDN